MEKNFIYTSLDECREFILTEKEVCKALEDQGKELVLASINGNPVAEIEKALVSHAMGSHVTNNIGEVKIKSLRHNAEGVRFRILASPKDV